MRIAAIQAVPPSDVKSKRAAAHVPTGPMRTEAATAGHWESKVWGRKYPRIQLLTVAELLDKRAIDMPPIRHVQETFKRASRRQHADQMDLDI